MKELLSNEEIDTLLDLFRTDGLIEEVSGNDFALEDRSSEEGPLVREIDLLKPNRFGREQMRSLERLFQGCAKSFTATMSDKLRMDMRCDCVAVEQMRLQGWVKSLYGPAAIYQLAMPPFDMPVLFGVTTGLLYGAVDRILGGSGRVLETRTEFTAAEYIVADAFVGPCLEQLCESLEDLGEFTWAIETRFCNPSMAQVIPGQDVVLSVHFQVSSELLQGDLRLAVPFSSIEPFLEGIEFGPGSAYRVPPGAMRETTTKTMESVPVDLSVLLGQTQVPLRQLLALEVGDVVALPTRVGEPLVAPVHGRPKFKGQVGTRGSQFAFQVGTVGDA